MQGAREDSKEEDERRPALVMRRQVVLEQHAVKGVGSCTWTSKTEESSTA